MGRKKVDYCGICGKDLYSYKHGGICPKCDKTGQKKKNMVPMAVSKNGKRRVDTIGWCV